MALHIVRLSVLVTAILFAAVGLAMGSALAAGTANLHIDVFPYVALAIATGAITLATVPAMIILEMIRPGGPTSMVVVEISWLATLSVLWLATGAETAQVLQDVDGDSDGFGFRTSQSGLCDSSSSFGLLEQDSLSSIINIGCSETKAIAAFGFLNWLLLMVYVFALLFLAIRASSRRQKGVWTSSVPDAPFFAPAEKDPVPHSYVPYPHVEQNTGTGGTVQAGTVHV
ncbi:hypothetical protein GGX14DRAFT_611091 [Mycena pura]|uniref:MARVEL domain-containing protein n=1 Tax=Mycena pura TaxID=153505 RepID=A0AAD6VJC3_9AGAR|nr:hypothetical protein GGX14DRAFT_611091 [Mycena pura]